MGLFTRFQYHTSSSDLEKHPPIPTQSLQSAIPDLEAARSSTSPIIDINPQNDVQNSNIVFWDSPTDPKNPLNWTPTKKYTNIALLSFLSFLTPLASSMMAPAILQIMSEFHNTSNILASFVVSVYVLGFAIGPIIFAPLSEMYGRIPVYWGCSILFTVFTIACAEAKSLGVLIGMRFLAGMVGGAPLSNGGGSISDMIVQEERGASMAAFAMGLLMGPMLGPVMGGYLAEAEGWRWVFWVIAIASGIATIFVVIFMRESYAPVILERKTKRLRKETGNPYLRSKLDPDLKGAAYFIEAIIRPLRMLILSPVVLCLSIYIGLCFGCLYLMFTTFSYVFTEVYHFSVGTDGLTFLGMGTGSLTALVLVGIFSDRILRYKALHSATPGELKPEYRLIPMLIGAPFIPIGLFWYGWSVQGHTHWIVPILGTVWIGFGFLIITFAVQMYLVDAFTRYAASALAATTILRSLVGALLPLAGRQMYVKLGYGWGNSLLAFMTAAMVPIPWLFYKYGEKLRRKRTFEF